MDAADLIPRFARRTETGERFSHVPWSWPNLELTVSDRGTRPLREA
jgi:hypothetical protein